MLTPALTSTPSSGKRPVPVGPLVWKSAKGPAVAPSGRGAGRLAPWSGSGARSGASRDPIAWTMHGPERGARAARCCAPDRQVTVAAGMSQRCLAVARMPGHRHFAAHVAEDPLGLAFRVMVLTGCQRGELCWLRWDDSDLDKGVLTISRTNGAQRQPDLGQVLGGTQGAVAYLLERAHPVRSVFGRVFRAGPHFECCDLVPAMLLTESSSPRRRGLV